MRWWNRKLIFFKHLLVICSADYKVINVISEERERHKLDTIQGYTYNTKPTQTKNYLISKSVTPEWITFGARFYTTLRNSIVIFVCATVKFSTSAHCKASQYTLWIPNRHGRWKHCFKLVQVKVRMCTKLVCEAHHSRKNASDILLDRTTEKQRHVVVHFGDLIHS